MKRLLVVPFIAGLLLAFFLTLSIQTGRADSATWKTNPGSGDWNHAANWMPPTIPNGPSDIATFEFSNTTDVFLSASTEVSGTVFNAGASPFMITVASPGVPDVELTFGGVGITNNSGVAQKFVTAPARFNPEGIIFRNSATAGNQTVFINNGSHRSRGGGIQFFDTATAGNGTF